MSTSGPSLTEQFLQEIREIPEAELPELLQVVRDFRERDITVSARECFRRGLHGALTWQTRPIEELWDGIDVEQGEAQ